MIRKVFVLGRTGSGKSTTVRFLTEEAQHYGWSVKSFNDYPILRSMFEVDQDKGLGRFRPTEQNGFEVLDFSVYKKAFHRLEWDIQLFRPASEKTLITIEFTSNHYPQALQSFSDEFLRSSIYFFIGADLKTCLDRVSSRALHAHTNDDYYVIDTILLAHYSSPYIPLYVSGKRVTFIHNMDAIEELETKIKDLVPTLLEQGDTSYIPALQRKSIQSMHHLYSSSFTQEWDSCPMYIR